VSLGTTPGLGDDQVIGRVLEAVTDLPVNAMVNLGGHLDAATLVPPPNAVIQGYVRHAAVMPHAQLVVTHAGLGTVVAALSFGVPLVCIPLGRDQPHNAERVDALGVGVVVPPDASAAQLRAAVERVLADQSYAEAARRFVTLYDPTARLAIDELESLH
jgi:MGT family glycosyltransferase